MSSGSASKNSTVPAMIKNVELLDFQAHKKLRIDFAPGISVIVGDSDVGKSAVFRALRWACQNTPDGNEFIRWGAKTAVVTVEAYDQLVVRSRGKSENLYFLNGDEFKSFGKGVPDQVAKALRLSDLNFQSQHDAPFWLAQGGSEVAREMNQIVNLEVIDGVLSAVAAKLRKARETVDVVTRQRDEAKAQVKELSPILDADDALKDVEAAHLDWQRKAAKARSLGELVASLDKLQLDVQASARGKRRGEILLKAADSWNEASKRADALHSLVLTLREARKAMRAAPDFAPVEKAWKALADAKARREALDQRIDGMRDLWRARKLARTERDAIHAELHEKSEGKCPLCGNHLPT